MTKKSRLVILKQIGELWYGIRKKISVDLTEANKIKLEKIKEETRYLWQYHQYPD